MILEQINFLEYSKYSLTEIIFKYINLKLTRNIRIILIDIEILIEDFIYFFKINKKDFKLSLHIKGNNILFDISNDYTYEIMNKNIISLIRESKIKYLLV